MRKIDAYDNELTRYIDLLTDISIKDIIGDIVDDILEADIPINISDEDNTVTVHTFTGKMKIHITKSGQNESSKTSVTIERLKGESIYEEYRLELDVENPKVTVEGFIIEERKRGVIVTQNIREYDYSNQEFRLINMQEKRSAYSYQRLKDAYIRLENENPDKTLKKNHHLLKQVFQGFPIEDMLAISSAKFNINLQDDKKIGNWPDFINININGIPRNNKYKSLTGDRLIKRIDDLLHGNITHQSLIDLRTLLNAPNQELFNPPSGFDFLANDEAVNSKGDKYETLKFLEEEQLGSSEVTYSREYFEYLRDLIIDIFQIEIPEELEKPSDLVQLLKSNISKD